MLIKGPHKLAGLLVLAMFISLSLPALAKKGGNEQHGGKGNHHGQGYNKEQDSHKAEHGNGNNGHHEQAAIDHSDRDIIKRYLAGDHQKHCPPGLAKKRNGCLPPGQAKHYVVGQPLPSTVTFGVVPRDLLVQLHHVPAGYRYVMVDKDVLLISEASKHVIDAVTLLSAVGQ